MPYHYPQITDKEAEGDKVKWISQGQAGSDKTKIWAKEIWESGTELSQVEAWKLSKS